MTPSGSAATTGVPALSGDLDRGAGGCHLAVRRAEAHLLRALGQVGVTRRPGRLGDDALDAGEPVGRVDDEGDGLARVVGHRQADDQLVTAVGLSSVGEDAGCPRGRS